MPHPSKRPQAPTETARGSVLAMLAERSQLDFELSRQSLSLFILSVENYSGRVLITPPILCLPQIALRNFTVFTASERDQRPLDDIETGLSLFTRHLVAGLSGHADSAPFGNGDGTVDSAEAFVYAAQRTAFAARKLSGVLQRPMISQGKTLAIGRIGAPSK